MVYFGPSMRPIRARWGVDGHKTKEPLPLPREPHLDVVIAITVSGKDTHLIAATREVMPVLAAWAVVIMADEDPHRSVAMPGPIFGHLKGFQVRDLAIIRMGGER